MASAKPEIIKQTDNELIIRSNDHRTIKSLKMPDGSFQMENSDGVKATFSPKDLETLVDGLSNKKHVKELRNRFRSVTRDNESRNYKGKDSNKLYPIATIGFTDELYPDVKSAIQTPYIKDKMLKSFSDFVRLAQNGKCLDIYTNDHKGKADEIIDCILEYPKVIVERDRQDFYDVAIAGIEALGEVRLPFPKITVISGEKINQDNLVSTVEEQDGTVNMLYCFFMMQHQDYVTVHTLFSRPDDIGDQYYVGHAMLHMVDGKLKLSRPIKAVKNNYELVNEEVIDTLVAYAIAAIYKLTVSGGDMYIATPTPDEIAVNKRRMTKGKKPLIEFRLITVDGNKPSLPSIPHGTHASPRLHWRRGHWRTMKKSGKKVWIDPMLVGDEENGKIIKDYAVGNYQERRSA